MLRNPELRRALLLGGLVTLLASAAAAQNGTLTAANVPGGAEFTMKLYKGIV